MMQNRYVIGVNINSLPTTTVNLTIGTSFDIPVVIEIPEQTGLGARSGLVAQGLREVDNPLGREKVDVSVIGPIILIVYAGMGDYPSIAFDVDVDPTAVTRLSPPRESVNHIVEYTPVGEGVNLKKALQAGAMI